MKVIFLLDSNEYVEVAPERLQIRQISTDQSALGIEVMVPVTDGADTANRKVVMNEDGTAKLQAAFRPFINYAVNLSLPEAHAEIAKAPQEKPARKAKKAKSQAN